MVITRAVRHRVLEWARFVVVVVVVVVVVFSIPGVDSRLYADLLARRQYAINVI